MPYTLNGFGTWYWGKERLHTTAGQCEFCGQFGQLRSYNTNLYVVALFIPLIPLGRKRILQECPRCTKHRSIPLKKWHELQARDIAGAAAAADADPRNEEKAATALGATVAYEAEEEFELLAEKFDRTLPHAPLLQAAIASGFEYFGKHERAEEHYSRSLAVKDDPEVREALAMLLLRTGRPDAARPHLQHIIDDNSTDKLPMLMALIELYQAKGQHAEAIDVLDQMEAAFSGLATDAGYRRARDTSEKHRASGKPINKGLLKTLAPQRVRRGSFASVLPRLIPPTIAAILLAWYLIAAYQAGQSRQVHLVNGLNLTYDVDINGRNYSLPAYAHRQIEIAEGEVRIDVRRLNISRTASLRTPFFTRPFKSPTFVLNPDGVALIAREQVIYTSGSTSAGDAEAPQLLTGSTLHNLGPVDYPFVDAPSQLQMSSDSSRVYKWSARQIKDNEPNDAVELALEYAGQQQAAAMVRNWVECEPDNRQVLMFVPFLVQPDDAVALLRPRLGERPVALDWHRIYQTVIERHRPEHDLHAEYAAMLRQQPDDPALCYLLARVTHDRAEARQLLRRATDAAEPVAYAHYALAFDAASEGDFEAALASARQALALEPTDGLFLEQETNALLALGRYSEALARVRARQRTGSDASDLVYTEIYILVRSGDVEGARRRAEQHAADVLRQGGDEAVVNAVRAHTQSLVAYVTGDEAAAGAARSVLPGNNARLESALCQGRLSDAARAAGELLGDKSTPYLLIYIAATLAGDEPAATQALDLAVKELRSGDYESRMLATWLSGDHPPAPEPAVHLLARPAEKRVWLTALGLKHPTIRPPCFQMVRTLNFDARFPHLMIKRATEAAR